MSATSRCLLLFLALVLVHTSCVGQEKRAIEPSDCVTVRYLSTGDTYNLYQAIAVNAQGSRLAYLVKSPNIKTNKNETGLYVKDLSHSEQHARLVKSSTDDMSELQWLGDGRHVAVLESVDNRQVVEEIDVSSGTEVVVARATSDITEFSIAKNDSALAFATEELHAGSSAAHSAAENARGYRIPFPSPGESASALTQRRIFVSKRESATSWTVPRPITITSPFGGVALTVLPYNANSRLSMSPDGTKLLVSYVSGDLPSEWLEDPTVKQLKHNGFPGATITVLYHVESRTTTMPFKTTGSWLTPVWSPDGKSYMMLAWSPVGSKWIEEDERDNLVLTDGGIHLFWIEPETERIEIAARVLADIHDQPVLSWVSNSSVMVRTGVTTISRFSHGASEWRDEGEIHLPLPEFPKFAELTSEGNQIFGDYQQITTPPELFSYEPGNPRVEVLEKLNPQFDHLTLAAIKKVQWKTSSGYMVTGILFLPTSFTQGVRYPLVIGTKAGNGGQFECDSGETHAPSFAPQPLANAGIAYIERYVDDDFNVQDYVNHRPKDYPGGIGEAALDSEIWDSAVEMLDRRGLIDRDKVGIIGFSRSGWYTEFTLTHSHVQYHAATLTDNVGYTMGEYWLTPEIDGGYDAMYDGPPYGKTLKSWMDYSISFNLDKIHTPVLMENMGYGALYDRNDVLPISLAERYEILSGLNRLNKPVELYYYPNENHLPKDPQARLASLERNVDWYRFWLQGYERPNPKDPDQYKRWEHLRELRDADAKTSSEPAQSGAK
jgi:dipeptidyl aminopeptidase/acylaminoacyl peptidase